MDGPLKVSEGERVETSMEAISIGRGDSYRWKGYELLFEKARAVR